VAKEEKYFDIVNFKGNCLVWVTNIATIEDNLDRYYSSEHYSIAGLKQ
jgi:hypothetical protein